MTWSHAKPGETLYAGMTYEDKHIRGIVTIHHARANVVQDEADSTFELLVCTIRRGQGIVAFGSGDQGDTQHYCASLVPAEGATPVLNADPRQQVLLGITPHHAGRVRGDGIELDYSYGWRRGRQLTGGQLRFDAR